MTVELKRIDDTVEYIENQSRRNNLRVDGVKVLEQDLKMSAEQVEAIAIERAHRTGGGPNADRDRTIVVKLYGFKARDAVL